jgi:hypothetical protein
MHQGRGPMDALSSPFSLVARQNLTNGPVSPWTNKLIIGCGYLGQRVAALRHVQGHRVLATTHQTLGGRAFEAESVARELLKPQTLQSLPAADTVLYAVDFDRTSGASMRAIYVDGLANVLDPLPVPKKFI